MLQAFFNIFKIPELRKRLLFTIFILVIYRIGFWIPLMGVDQATMADAAKKAAEEQSVFGAMLDYISIFTGGSFSQSTLFGLGIMPYISAAIIFQLLGTVSDKLKKLQQDPAGRQKFQEYIRYATVGLCVIQAAFWMSFLESQQWVYPDYSGSMLFWLSGVTGMTAGTVFMMWLGEQIDKYGIGNGASLIITAGILARMDDAALWVGKEFATIGPMKLLLLVGGFILVVGGSVLITQGQRRIPVQQAKHTRGRRVYGGQRSYLPLRVNHGGVMPIIFASSLMMLPTMIFGALAGRFQNKEGFFADIFNFLNNELGKNQGGYLYTLVYVVMIYFFAYFWTTVQFQPKEMSTQLRDHGSFIPGLRPGPRTAEHLEKVMERITYVGAGFLAVIAVIPTLVSNWAGIPFFVSAFLGGTGLLITVSVCLDFVQRIEAQLLMRNYSGFLSSGKGGKGPRIRGAHGG